MSVIIYGTYLSYNIYTRHTLSHMYKKDLFILSHIYNNNKVVDTYDSGALIFPTLKGGKQL